MDNGEDEKVVVVVKSCVLNEIGCVLTYTLACVCVYKCVCKCLYVSLRGISIIRFTIISKAIGEVMG